MSKLTSTHDKLRYIIGPTADLFRRNMHIKCKVKNFGNDQCKRSFYLWVTKVTFLRAVIYFENKYIWTIRFYFEQIIPDL